jgi:superfamily II DNA or RNA helicase
VSAILPLRRYQRDAIDAVREGWKTTGNRQVVILATGLGKTVVFAHAAKEHLDDRPGDRVLVLVHTEELANQAAHKISQVAPHLSVGVVMAGRNQTTADVIVASVQTLRSEKRRAQVRGVGLVIVDECHHATAATYRTILAHYGCMGTGTDPIFDNDHQDPPTPAIGFTATLMRGDGGPLHEIWPNVAFARHIGYGVRQGFLVPPHAREVRVPDFNLAHVRATRADFREGDLGDALTDSLAPSVVAQAYVEHARDRSGIMFCPTVASAEIMAEAMRAEGVTCEVVSGAMDRSERAAVLRRLEAGVTQVVANCMVLTEGFDSPRVSCVVVARPTKSKGLYIQMVGRGLRVDPTRTYAEQDCLILDVTGTGERHDLCSIVDLSEKPIDPDKARSGRSLIDLEDEFDRGEDIGPEDESHAWTGPVDVTEYDPLAQRTKRGWNRTDGGTYFMPAGPDAYVFVVDGAVVWCTRSGTPYCCRSRLHDDTCTPLHGRIGGITEHVGLDPETAFGWAEDLAVDMGESLIPAVRTARRVREVELSRARALGIEVRPGMKTTELSPLIDKVTATQVIDRWAPKVRAALAAQNTESGA